MNASWLHFSASIFLKVIFCGWLQCHRKSVKEKSDEYIPLEIWEKIFLRLPVKSLVKCSCVCKAWKSIITNQDFIIAHYKDKANRAINNGNNAPLFLQYRTITYPRNFHSKRRRCPPVEQKITSKQFLSVGSDDKYNPASCLTIITSSLRTPNEHDLKVVGTCNGLVCFLYKYSSDQLGYDQVILMNLSIRKYILLPKSCVVHPVLDDTTRGVFCYNKVFGFGFDSRNNDFKVVMFSLSSSMQPHAMHVEVYSLATGQWRIMTNETPTFWECIHIYGTLIFVNGVLHWLRCCRKCIERHRRIVSTFDLAEETFGEIMLPHGWDDEPCFNERLMVRGNYLAFACVKRSVWRGVTFNIWVMKEYGIVDSWNLVVSVNDSYYRVQASVIALRSCEGMVVRYFNKRTLLVDDLIEEKKDLELEKFSVLGFAGDYEESLFLINHKNMYGYNGGFLDVRSFFFRKRGVRSVSTN